MPYCCWYQSNTCCGNVSMIMLSDFYTKLFNHFENTGLKDNSRCFAYLYGLSCMFCSPTTTWLNVSQTEDGALWVQVLLCPGVCNTISRYCGEWVNSQNVTESSEDVCITTLSLLNGTLEALGKGKLDIRVRETNNCFQPASLFQIQTSGCYPGNSIGALPVWSVALISVGVFLCCIGTCCGAMVYMRRTRKGTVEEEIIEISSAFDPDEEEIFDWGFSAQSLRRVEQKPLVK